MNANESFPRSRRITGRAVFERAYKSGRVATDDCLVVHAAPNGGPSSRLGLSLSRHVGNAPLRNRWKRIIREAFRRSQRELPAGLDLVIRPRKGAACDYHAVKASLIKLANRLQKQQERKS